MSEGLLNITSSDLSTVFETIARADIRFSRKRVVMDAAKELFDNATIYGAPPIVMEFTVSEHHIEFRITDAGGTLDRQDFERARKEGPISVQFRDGGAGIGLARSLRESDAAFCHIVPNRTTSICLRWKRSAPSARY